MDQNNCSNGVRCEHIFIDVSKFDNLESESDGGAIHLIDCCLTFTNCQSRHGGGGAIYIENNLKFKNNITLTGLSFNDCKAKFGGAIYVYCGALKVPVKVSSCTFSRNQLLPNSERDHFHKGGKAIFFIAKRGKISECKFHENSGEGEDMKIITTFDEYDYLLKDNQRKMLIREVEVEDEDEEYENDHS